MNFSQFNEILLELWPFAISGFLILLLSGAQHKIRTMYANVLKIYIWIPHEKIGDQYFFFLSELSPILELLPFK